MTDTEYETLEFDVTEPLFGVETQGGEGYAELRARGPVSKASVTARHAERMRETFAHEAVLVMDPHGDLRAPGGAVTRELCGAFEHEPPCPVAEHHTEAERIGGEVVVRTVFAAAPEDEGAARA